MTDPLFGFDYENLSTESIEVNLIRRMSKLWTNFAKYGHPMPDNMEFKQLQRNINQYNYAKLTNDKIESGINPYSERMEFWNNLYQKYKYLL